MFYFQESRRKDFLGISVVDTQVLELCMSVPYDTEQDLWITGTSKAEVISLGQIYAVSTFLSIITFANSYELRPAISKHTLFCSCFQDEGP